MDITQEILRQHTEQRQLFAVMDELDPADVEKVAAVWHWLAALLEAHAAAEEELFYPRLLEVGHGPGEDAGAEDETKDAIKDHNEIRAAVARTRQLDTGSDDWWAAVRAARVANSDHMAEEERDDLADFRRHAPLAMRHELAVDFLAQMARVLDSPFGGGSERQKDPEAYVEHH